jgi:Septum formation
MSNHRSSGSKHARAAAGGMAIAVALLLAAPGVAHGLGEPIAGKRVTPQRYVREVCSALGDWIDATLVADEGMIETLDAAAGDAQTSKIKADAVAFAKDAVVASDELITTTFAIGTPKMRGGVRTAEDHLAVLMDIRDRYADALKAAKGIKVTDAASVEEAIETIADDAYDEFLVIGSPLETLQADETLQPIIDGEGECSYVIDAYTASTESYGYAPGNCVDGYEVVDCAEAHEYEVYLVAQHPAPEGEAFPGNKAVNAYADEQCTAAYEGYMGIPLLDSTYTYIWLSPDAELWEAGDREFVCGVANVSDDKITGVLQGSGR